jgi:hydrogenase maturation protease
MHVLIAGVGYTNLRDLSVGPFLVPRLREMDWPEGVEVDDWSFGPIAVVQRLQDRPGYYDRIVFVSAAERGREPGSVYRGKWEGHLPDPAEIQDRMGEAVTGVISLDNLLVITQHFGVLPSEVIVVEVEPLDTGWGPAFSPPVERALDEVVSTVRRMALDGYQPPAP